MKSEFLLNPEIIYLNHGSFGACPKPVFEDYQRWQRELEAEPVQFITKTSHKYLKASKEVLADFIGCNAKDFFFTPNPTFAINVIMRSLKLNPGDEILSTNHEYGAMDRTWNFYCKKSGARYIRQPITLPVVSKEQILEEFWKGYNSSTKIIFLNQISSATALIFPVKEIVVKAKELGLITIIDGAHVPGHIDLNISELDPDFYMGTAHKWLLTPKGSSFLYVSEKFQDQMDPLVVSWGYESDNPGESRFLDYHEFQGTRDISAYLTIPAAMKFLQESDFKTKRETCKKLILENYKRFCDLLGSEPICPITEEFLGQMCSIPLKTDRPSALKELLFEKYKIEIPVMSLNGNSYIRISAHFYNTQQELDFLYSALQEIIAKADLIST